MARKTKWDAPVEVLDATLQIRVIDTRRSSVWSYDHGDYPCHQDLTKRSDYSVLRRASGAQEMGLMPTWGTNSRVHTYRINRLARN